MSEVIYDYKINEAKRISFEKLIAEINNETLYDSILPQRLAVALTEITDEISESSSFQAEMFKDMVNKTITNTFLEFKGKPITYSIEKYPEPLILISDETELDMDTRNIVFRRHENGFVTFPIILFSDSFFNLVQGETLSYKPIIETFEKAAKERVMAFRRSDTSNIESYIEIVSKLIRLYKYVSILDEVEDYLVQEINQRMGDVEKNKDAAFTSIMQLNQAKTMCAYYEVVRMEKNKLNNQISEWKAEINIIMDNYDKQVLSYMSDKDVSKLSAFAVNIDLKYGRLQEDIRNFLNLSLLNDNNFDSLNDSLCQIKKDTKESMAHRTSTLSLIGTFSSGKTTLINTFLGERDVQLKTSMGHNTAVLMKLFYEESENEYYDIIYSKKLIWTLVKPGAAKKPATNKSGYKLKVLSITEANGTYTITCQTIAKEKKELKFTIRSDAQLIVKKGDELENNEPFVMVPVGANKTVEICSKSEIDLIRKIHQKFSGVITLKRSINNQTLTKSEASTFLKILYEFAGEKNNTILYAEFCKHLLSNHINVPIDQNGKLDSKYQSIVFESSLNYEDERKILDKRGWIDLCGDAKSEKKIEAFSEKPECYMLAKELELHINSEFLQYCSLTDTPGFGSVTEEHDSITESYIRDSTGRLLVMIAINAKTMDGKYQDLINNINDIYDNFRKKDKKNVVFVLNCFTNLAAEDRLKKHVYDVVKMLTARGFNKKNIFVCNLKKSLEEKQNTEKMFGYPSYMAFHDFIINEMISTDLLLKYKSIKDKWDKFFVDSQNTIENKIEFWTNAINDLERRRKKINNDLATIKNIDLNTISYSYEDIYDFFNDMSYQLKDAYTSGNFFKGLIRDKIRSIISSLKESSSSDLDIIIQDDIKNLFATQINNINYHAQIEPPELSNYDEWSNTSGAIVVYEIGSIEHLLDDAVENTPRSFLVFGKSAQAEKQSYYKSQIDSKISEYREYSLRRAESYFTYCYSVVNSYKRSAIADLEQTLKQLDSKEKLEQALQESRRIKANLIEMKNQFIGLRWIKFE